MKAKELKKEVEKELSPKFPEGDTALTLRNDEVEERETQYGTRWMFNIILKGEYRVLMVSNRKLAVDLMEAVEDGGPVDVVVGRKGLTANDTRYSVRRA